MPERSGAVLAATLEPGDDAVGGQHLGHRVGDVLRALVDNVRSHQPGLEIVLAESPAEVSPRHRLDSVAQPVGDVQRRAQCGASVTRGGLHPDMVEGTSAAKRELATQLRATPPAIVKVVSPVWRCSQPASSRRTSSRRDLYAAGQVGVSLVPTIARAEPLGECRPING